MHRAVHIRPDVADAPLATYARLPDGGEVRRPKRPHELVDALLLCQDTLHFSSDIDAHQIEANVRLERVDAWHTRMQSGTLVHPSHAALLNVLDDENEPLVTVPLMHTSSAWLLTALHLPIVHIQAHLTWDKHALALHIHIFTTNACFAAQAPATADALRTIVEHANDVAGTRIPRPTDVDEVSGAALVYESLCRRELDPATQMPPAEQPRALLANLLPFQRRSVSFLLEREASPAQRRSLRSDSGPWWGRVGHTDVFFNVLTGAFTTDPHVAANDDVRGAILAEEMGLGKTIEVLALLLEHSEPGRNDLPGYYDRANEAHVKPVGTTLIVSPETLRRQWLDEIATYAPALRVYSYTGHRQAAHDANGVSWGEWAAQLDVMVVSFETLSRDLAASHAAPPRMLRQPSRYERPRSPLVQLEFLRVVMDEVQLVGGKAAETMAMIRRHGSLAVSGTPVRRLSDLRTSLWFLGLVPASMTTPRAWKRILSPELAPYVCRVLYDVGIRHTKAQVAHEMILPPQSRYLVPVDFTHVETAFYRDVWHASLAALHLDADGAPQSDTWELDTGVLRAQLQRLRQACTHPNVALRGGHVLGTDATTGASGTTVNLRSIEQVLAQMIETSKHDLATHKHVLITRRIHRASVLLFAPRDQLEAWPEKALHADEVALVNAVQASGRLSVARDQLETLLPDAQAHVDELEEEIRTAQVRGPLYAFSEDELDMLGKYSDDADSLPADAPHEKLRLRQQYTSALRSRQRHWLQVVHRIQQFSGHCYFQLGESVKQQESEQNQAGVKKEEDMKQETPYTSLEDAAYQSAELTRQRLLVDAREHVDQCVGALRKHDVNTQQLQKMHVQLKYGVAGRAILDEVLERLKVLRAHAALVLDWRAQIYARLTKPVNREVNRAREDDDVYAENLDAQIEAETLMEMYRPLLAQRDELLTGKIALGATARPQLYVELDRELRAARARRFQRGDDDDQEEEEEENEVRQAKRLQLNHFRALEEARKEVMLPSGAKPLSALIAAVRDERDSAVQMDAQLLTSTHSALQAALKEHLTLLDALRKEQMQFQALFNARAMYFKQVQELSDQVQDPDMPQGAWPAVLADLAQERQVRQKIGSTQGRLRYLDHVKHIQDSTHVTTDNDEARRCFICTNVIETGILTNACGHLMCESCFQAWFARGHRTCPMCKTRLAPKDVHRVVYREPATLTASAHATASGSAAFRVLPAATRHALDEMALEGGSGSKLDMLIRHLAHIQRTTGEKSLVFSSFARGLDLVADSLSRHGIAFARLDGTGGKRASAAIDAFQHAPDVRVLLLHSEAQSAGLNLLAATHLFLLEPLLNHAMELQAIGRVHRIGQTRPTHVYGYMVRDTVEERITALAAERSQSLYLDVDEVGAGDTALLQAAHDVAAQDMTREIRRGDLVGSTNDLLACLFSQHLGSTVTS